MANAHSRAPRITGVTTKGIGVEGSCGTCVAFMASGPEKVVVCPTLGHDLASCCKNFPVVTTLRHTPALFAVASLPPGCKNDQTDSCFPFREAAMPIALITGAASGIGYALALRLAREGYSIAAIDRSREGLIALSDRLVLERRKHAWRTADVVDEEGLRQAITALEREVGSTDVVIPGAGIGIETGADPFRADLVRKVIEVNLIGVSNTIAAVLPGMLQRKQGHIVGLSSLASFRGLPRMFAYCASKSGLNALLEGLRVEVEPRGVAVSIVCPGWIRTPMTADVVNHVPNLLEVEDAVERMVSAIRRRRRFFAFPRRSAYVLRFLRWLPEAWQIRILGKMTASPPKPASDPK
jgi:short-subunit dehydrogenase